MLLERYFGKFILGAESVEISVPRTSAITHGPGGNKKIRFILFIKLFRFM